MVRIRVCRGSEWLGFRMNTAVNTRVIRKTWNLLSNSAIMDSSGRDLFYIFSYFAERRGKDK